MKLLQKKNVRYVTKSNHWRTLTKMPLVDMVDIMNVKYVDLLNVRHYIIKKPISGFKYCSKCKKTKEVSEFHADKSDKSGLQSYCYQCVHKGMHEWASTLEGNITKLFNDLKQNAKKRAKKLSVEITKQYIIDLYHQQTGLCAITKQKMTHIAYSRGEEKKHIINNINISVDRIDSNKGYTKDNIQLVCAIINRMKSDLSNEQFVELCNLVCEGDIIKKQEHYNNIIQTI